MLRIKPWLFFSVIIMKGNCRRHCQNNKTMKSRQNGSSVEALDPFYMITLLAESKTMASLQSAIQEKEYSTHTPALENIADALMQHMESLSPSSIAEILGISQQLAVKAHSLAYDFPHKLSGYKALYAFTGEAYRGLDVKTLSEEGIKRADDDLRIISSVYGILKPTDIIKPYRCEFNKPVFPDKKTSIQVFKPKITIELVNHIKENKISEIIDLLPGDADKCVDWKIVRAFATVHKVCFQQITAEGRLKTPIASRLKDLRGKMARMIFSQGIQSFKDLSSIPSEDFAFSVADSKPGLPVFITA